MCLGIPGRIEQVPPAADPLERVGTVSFGDAALGGVARVVSLAFVPEAGVGDWVVVHAGVAIARVDAEQAARTLRDLGLPVPEGEP